MTSDRAGDVAPADSGERTSPFEAHLLSVFREVLMHEYVAPDDDFFSVGGHSLLAMRAVARIEQRLGVRIPISLLFDHPTVCTLAPRIEELVADPSQVPEQPQATSAVPGESLPLSPAQRGLWFLDQAIGRHAAYVLPDAWRLRGRLDVERLRQAIEAVVARHPSLSTRFEIVDGEPRQRISPPGRIELPVLDLRHVPAHDQAAAVERAAAEEAERPFDLAKDPMLRASLLALGEEDHALLLTVHHVASDAWSQRVLREELGRIYRSTQPHAPMNEEKARPAVGDAPAQQRLSPKREAELAAYWRRQLADLPRLELPVDRRRLTAWSDHGAEFTFEIPAAVTCQLERLAVEARVTLQMLLLGAYQVLLGRYTGQEDFGVATFASDRRDAMHEDAIGLFVNTIVLRADLSGAPTFRQLLARVRRTSLDAYDHREFPFEALLAELQPAQRGAPNALTPAAFQFLPFGDTPPELDGLDVTRLPSGARRVRFDLELTIWKESAGFRAVLGYSTDLFDDETITRFAGYYVNLLEAIVDAPDSPAAELDVLTDADREEQIERWSGASTPGIARPPVHDIFVAQAAATPDATALVFGDTRLSYRELDEQSGRLVARLRSAGVAPGDVVAIHADRSVELIVAMLGVLKQGAAYLPLDPSHPADRLAFMVEHARANVLLASSSVPESLSSRVQKVVPIEGSIGGPESAEADPSLPSPRQASASSLAYVMYTSGSTGQPKGVAVPHRGIARLVRESTYVRFTPRDCVAFASNPAFDAATFEIWGALLNGGRLVSIDRDTLLSPPQLAQMIQAHGITVMFLTSALFHQVAALAPGILASLNYVVAGGDVVDPAAARAVLSAGAPAHLLNGYGPTENTTFSTSYEITLPLMEGRSIPIGRPIDASTCYVLDSRRRLLPVGAPGELYVGGTGLALGYINSPELTAERFVPHPFVGSGSLYRTGDRVRWRADGNLEFLGRIDRQIKLRGHRIELEEIEHALSRHEDIAACTVVLDEARAGDPRLVAYVVGRHQRQVASTSLRAFLRQTLPSYMVPDVIAVLAALPLTPNGKVDRAALPALVGDLTAADVPGSREPAPAGSSRMEASVADAFREVLGLHHFGRQDGFFDLGGTSLMAFRLADRLSATSGRTVSVSSVFAHPTVAALAAFLAASDGASRPPSIVEFQRGGRKPPLYFPPGLLGDVMVTAAFREGLPADQPLYGLQDSIGDGPPAASMEAMARRLCADITSFQPEGPLSLAGYSFGGLLAYEMARQLTEAGREIRVLAILDTGPDLSTGASLKDALTRLILCLENIPRWIGEDLIRTLSRDTPATLWRSVRKLARSVASAPTSDTAGQLPVAEDLFDTSAWSSALLAHVNNNLRLLETFRYGLYPGRVTLIRARVRPLFHAHAPDLGWSALAREVRVVDAPGNHHSMTLEPHVRVVVRRLREILES